MSQGFSHVRDTCQLLCITWRQRNGTSITHCHERGARTGQALPRPDSRRTVAGQDPPQGRRHEKRETPGLADAKSSVLRPTAALFTAAFFNGKKIRQTPSLSWTSLRDNVVSWFDSYRAAIISNVIVSSSMRARDVVFGVSIPKSRHCESRYWKARHWGGSPPRRLFACEDLESSVRRFGGSLHQRGLIRGVTTTRD